PYGSPGYYPAAVTAQVLAWGKASLLYRRLIRERRVAQDVTAYAFPFVVGAAMLVIWATARPGVTADALEAALVRELATLRDVDTADVERAIHLIAARQLSDLQRVDERADLLSMFTMLFDDPDRINTELDRVRAVTPHAVREIAESRIIDDHRATLQNVPRDGRRGSCPRWIEHRRPRRGRSVRSSSRTWSGGGSGTGSTSSRRARATSRSSPPRSSWTPAPPRIPRARQGSRT